MRYTILLMILTYFTLIQTLKCYINPHIIRDVGAGGLGGDQVTLPTINERFVSILYFEVYDKIIYEIAARYQIPDFLANKNI